MRRDSDHRIGSGWRRGALRQTATACSLALGLMWGLGLGALGGGCGGGDDSQDNGNQNGAGDAGPGLDAALDDAALPDAAGPDAAPDAGFVCDPAPGADSIYNFEAESLSELRTISLCEYRGDVLLIVNIAALCGYTFQLGTLAEIQTAYESQGFEVLGFYSDQFANQAGDEEQRSTCEQNYGVNFTTFDIIDVNGANAHPLFVWLKDKAGGGDIDWNFEKFLVARDGTVLERWRTATEPDDAAVTSAIETALQASP